MQIEIKPVLKSQQLLLSEVKWRDCVSLNIKYHRGKTNNKHLSFHCSQVTHLCLIVSWGKTVMSGLLGVIWGLVMAVGEGLVLTGCARPWGLWRLPRWCGWWSCGPDGECGDPPAQPDCLHPDESSCCTTDSWREKQSARQTAQRTEADMETERKRGKTGGRKRNVLCEVWNEMTGWQNAEAARDIIILKFHGWFNVYLPLCDVLFHCAFFFTTRC